MCFKHGNSELGEPVSRGQGSNTFQVSIVTPFYNTNPAIFEETVQSVFAQTLQDWEWIIVNDGSSDPEALAVLQEFRNSSDSRIRVVDQRNRGLPAARNAGVAASTAPLLFFLDSDDLIMPTALEKLVALFESEPSVAFATSWIQAFGAKSFLWQHGFDSGNMFLFENTVTALCMVRRSVFTATGGFDEERVEGLEDYEFWFRCAAHGYWGRDIAEPLIMQRYKYPAEYVHYQWPVRDQPARLRAFRQEMRSRYPDLFRVGVLHISSSQVQPGWRRYGLERIALWIFPLTCWLRDTRLRLVKSSFWALAGPLWRWLKRMQWNITYF